VVVERDRNGADSGDALQQLLPSDGRVHRPHAAGRLGDGCAATVSYDSCRESIGYRG
jgi:hypothetical protein